MQLQKLTLRLLTLQTLCLLALSIPVIANAQRPVPGPNRPHRPDLPDVKVAHINKTLTRGMSLDVIRELGIQRELAMGKSLIALSVEGSPAPVGVRLTLSLNGQRIDEARLGRFNQEASLRLPSYISDRDRLFLNVDNPMHIRKISAHLSAPTSYPGPGGGYGDQDLNTLRATLNQQVYNYELLHLRQLISSQTGQNLQGLEVEKVILKASSASRYGSPAQAQLLVNGQPVGRAEYIDERNERMVFELPRYSRNVIGQDIRTLQLEIRGDAHLKMVALKVKEEQRRGPRSLQVNVNRSFYSPERVRLSDLLARTPGARPNEEIEAISIVARGRGTIVVAENGFNTLGIINVSSSGARSESVAAGYSTLLRDVELRVMGNLTIESIRVKLK